MTSLIDVIFLLLLFFMLSSTFTRFGAVDFGSPGKAGASGSTGAPDILVTLSGDALRINGVDLGDTSLETRLGDLVARGAVSLMILPREGANAQMLVDTIEAARRIRTGTSAPLAVTIAR